MRRQLEGSRGIALAVARCRPNVVPAYPITPQTHIVEAIGAMIKNGDLKNCEFVTVESEFGAMSAAIGASAAGARTYTATASQGLLYMAEALFNAAGLGLPIVLTVANRAIGAPINIWNDQSDSMSLRDCGWIQLYAADNQAATDLHILAFALAEELSVPVMVCVDGFVLTHAFEPIDVPDQDQIDRFLPAYQPRQELDVDAPTSIGAMVGPEAFTEVRYLSQHQQSRAVEIFGDVAGSLADSIRREPTMIETYRTQRAGTVVVALGSVSGTVKEVVDSFEDVGLLTLTLYRPFPYEAVAAALAGAERVIVLERAFAPGAGGVVAADVRTALAGRSAKIITVVAGLGGRSIRTASLGELVAAVRTEPVQESGPVPDVRFLDLRTDLIDAELTRMKLQRETGPHALHLLRGAGTPGSRVD